MKIGIISEFSKRTVNYGNHLQAYALNAFLRSRYHVECVESIALDPKQPWIRTKYLSVTFLKEAVASIARRLGVVKPRSYLNDSLLAPRLKCFEDFRNRWFPDRIPTMKGEDFGNSDYDAIIVGSDVAWLQLPIKVCRTKFLDFTAKKPFKRISYAASFGRDYIPKENIPYIRKCLNGFDAVSVRERSSVSMLKEIGVPHVSYCMDPTLLLTAEQWEQVEHKPAAVIDEEFIFVYLLGQDKQQREDITSFAKAHGLKVLYVPNALGMQADADDALEGIQVEDCSIENWIWLIHHAKYVIVDSFHGAVFSAIFNKKFVVLKRYTVIGYDINNRMQDFLSEVGQLDKSITSDLLSAVDSMTWDYEKTNEAIAVRVKDSISYLDRVIGEIHV